MSKAGGTSRAGIFSRVKDLFKAKPSKVVSEAKVKSAPKRSKSPSRIFYAKSYSRTECGGMGSRSNFIATPKRKGKTKGGISRMKMRVRSSEHAYQA